MLESEKSEVIKSVSHVKLGIYGFKSLLHSKGQNLQVRDPPSAAQFAIQWWIALIEIITSSFTGRATIYYIKQADSVMTAAIEPCNGLRGNDCWLMLSRLPTLALSCVLFSTWLRWSVIYGVVHFFTPADRPE